jgi:hypothetical protein
LHLGGSELDDVSEELAGMLERVMNADEEDLLVAGIEDKLNR